MNTKFILLLFVLIFNKGFAQSDFDTDFGSEGVFIQENIEFGGLKDIAFQGNDKIIGQSYIQDVSTGAIFRSLFRINLDGTLDTGFGNNGVFKDDASIIFNNAGALVVNEDAIYTVSSPILPGTTKTNISITKLDANGVIDTDFGINGYATIPPITDTDWADGVDMKINNNGDIIATGLAKLTSTGEKFIIVTKFLANGTLDASFGTNGIYQHPISSGFEPRVTGVLVNDDESILILANLMDLSVYVENLSVVKLNPTGILDSSFGTNGSYNTNQGGDLTVTYGNILDDNSILLYGLAYDGNFAGMSTKISAEGVLDLSYGVNGFGESFFGGADIVVNYAQMIPKEDYFILIGDVFDFTINDGTRRIIATRLNTDGTFDNSYGTNGTSFFDSPLTDYIDLRGRNAISRGDNFYIACEASLQNANINPAIVKLVEPQINIGVTELDRNSDLLFPNPVNNNTVLCFTSIDNKVGELSITNISGQKKSSRSIEIQSGTNTISLSQDISPLSKGAYFVNLKSNGNNVISLRFIK